MRIGRWLVLGCVGCGFRAPVGNDAAANDVPAADTGPSVDVAPPDIEFIQSAINTSNGDFVVRTVELLNQAAGNFQLVVIGWNSNVGDVVSVTDTALNTYRRAIPKASSGILISQTVFYAYGIAQSASNTLTVVFDGVTHDIDLRVFEYRGVLATSDPLDATASSAQTIAPTDSGPLVTTYPSALIVGANTVFTTSVAPGAGFTSRGITVFGDLTEDMVVSVAGTYRATATLNSNGEWVMQAASFKAR